MTFVIVPAKIATTAITPPIMNSGPGHSNSSTSHGLATIGAADSDSEQARRSVVIIIIMA